MSIHRDLLPQPHNQTPSPALPVTRSPAQSRMGSPNNIMPKLERQHSLADYFEEGKISRTCYTDQEFGDIATLLKESDRHTWSRVPRIYTVLRLIDQLTALDLFLDLGLSDLWLPFNVSQLPQSMSAYHRNLFVEQQNVVLTKVVDMESPTAKKHTHFRKGEEFPVTMKGKLGQGGFGAVYEVFSPFSGRTYALKKFRRTKVNQREVQSFMTELQVLQRINHHHCVELVASYTDQKTFGLLMSPVADRNLNAYYDFVAENTENRNTLRTFFGCLAHALHFLHESKIRHRDIKPDNILVKGTDVYLTDFGISLDWDGLSRSTTTADSAKSYTYCAPEVANYEPRNSSSDIWALGCVFVEMLTVLQGFTVKDLRERMNSNSGRHRFYENIEVVLEWVKILKSQGTQYDVEVSEWIRTMVVEDPSARSTAHSLAISIAKYSKGIRGEGISTSFCGDCCTYNYDPGHSSDAASDDDDWGACFDIDSATSLTAPPVANTPRHPQTTHSIINHQKSLEHRQDSTVLRKTEALSMESIYKTTRMDREPCISGDSKAILDARHKEITRRPVLSVGIYDTDDYTTRSWKIWNVRLELVNEFLDKHEPWSLLEVNLEDLRMTDFRIWKRQEDFLQLIQSNLDLKKALEMVDPGLMQRLETARSEDLVPIVHFLLINNFAASLSELRLAKALSYVSSGTWDIQVCLDIAKLLIGFGAYPSISNFQAALRTRNAEFPQMILRTNPDLVDVLRTDNLTICTAVQYDQHDIVRLLIEHGALTQLNDRDSFDPRLCSAAAEAGHLAMLKTLIEHGGLHPDEEDFPVHFSRTRWRPIHWAANFGDTEMVKYLLKKGADPSYEAGNTSYAIKRSSPYDIAKKNGFEVTAKVLEEAIAKRKK